MNVGELIEILKGFGPFSEVLIHTDYDVYSVEGIAQDIRGPVCILTEDVFDEIKQPVVEDT